MVQRLEQEQSYLYQEQVAYGIRNRYGEDHVYWTKNGNLAINRTVLKEFRKLTEGKVMWERGDKAWRRREAGDSEGRVAY
jgi:hypothetical protein